MFFMCWLKSALSLYEDARQDGNALRQPTAVRTADRKRPERFRETEMFTLETENSAVSRHI